jgi:hypothetical protein
MVGLRLHSPHAAIGPCSVDHAVHFIADQKKGN